jgi:hypothetical protein
MVAPGQPRGNFVTVAVRDRSGSSLSSGDGFSGGVSRSFLRLVATLLYHVVRRFEVGRLWFRLPLRVRGLRCMAKRDEERKMVGPDVLQHGKLVQSEGFFKEHMIERPFQKRPVRVERRVRGAPDPGIQQSAHFLKQAVGPRQCDVVQIAGDDRRRGLVSHFVADDQQFGIAFLGILQRRRLGV